MIYEMNNNKSLFNVLNNMESGVVATVESDAKLSDFYQAFSREEETSGLCLEVRENRTLQDGHTVQTGRAVLQEIATEEKVDITDGEIIAREQPSKNTELTNFLYVPGSFAVVGSSSGKFAFDLFERITEQPVNTASPNLDRFLKEKEEADPWKVGFEQERSQAENGVIHGEDLLHDPEVGNVLANSKKNQIGVEYNWDGKLLKVFITSSGYIEVYQPESFDTTDFVSYIEQEHLPYC